jgi:hypothetical protein
MVMHVLSAKLTFFLERNNKHTSDVEHIHKKEKGKLVQTMGLYCPSHFKEIYNSSNIPYLPMQNGYSRVYTYAIRLQFPFLLQYTIAMMGYDDEDKTTVIELTYNYGVTEYSKGNAYAQVSMKSFLCIMLLQCWHFLITVSFF